MRGEPRCFERRIWGSARAAIRFVEVCRFLCCSPLWATVIMYVRTLLKGRHD
jgi:hypothetical protein